MKKYAAKLLFQFRFQGEPNNPFRIVEERIISLQATTGRQALLKAKKAGRSKQRSFVNDDGVKGRFEFVGILDLLHLGAECEANEVWYDIRRMKSPMERKRLIIPNETELSAIRHKT